MNLRDILRTASSNLWRSKTRTILTIIAIFIGALTLSLTNGIGSGISSYINRELGNIGAADALSVTPVSQDTTSSGPKKYDSNRVVSNSLRGPSIPVLTDADVAKIKATPGIRKVEILRNPNVDYIQGPNGQKYQIAVSEFLSGTNLDMASGQKPYTSGVEAQIALPIDYVQSLGFTTNQTAVGQVVNLAVTDTFGKQTVVSAVVSGVQQKSLLSLGGAEINEVLTNRLYDIQSADLPSSASHQYEQVIARFDPSISSADLTRLKNRLKDQGYKAETIKDAIGSIEQVINGVVLALDAFGIIALLAASFGIINTLLMAVQERTKEIGLMKAMGMGSGRIFLLFSAEAILLGFWGSLLGSLAAIGIGHIVDQVASKNILKDLVGLQLLSFPLQSVLLIMALIIVIAFLAGTLPARRAARQNPIEALRYE